MNTRNKTFIIFSPAFTATEADTIWLPSLQVFIRALNKNFPELNVIVFAFQYPYTTAAYTWHNNKIIPFNGMHKKRTGRLLMWLNIFYETRKIKKQSDITGIFSLWCGECSFVAKYIAKFCRLQHFCWILGQDARKENIYVKRIHPKAASLVTISDFLVDEFYSNHGIKPQHVIPIGIDTSLFNKLPQHKDIDIIGAGSLSILKRYDLFVQVMERLKKNLPGIYAVLCGDGEDRERIESMIAKLSLTQNITLRGFLEHAEVLQMMRRAKILLHPSSYEGFGIVCLEALYAGAHVISFVQPMHLEIKNWHIVKTAEEMYAKALNILQDTNTKYEPVSIYSINDTAKAVMKLFRYNS